MSKIRKIKVTTGVYWVEIPDAGLYILCGCPADSVKHLMKRGIIVSVEDNGITYETGPNAILLFDVQLSHGLFQFFVGHLLGGSACMLLDSLGIDNVHYAVADGSKGYSQAAPFDAILVTAACPEVPAPLIEQLDENGRLVAPVGSKHTQDLILLKCVSGHTIRQSICPCRFVPLLGEYAFEP